MVRGTCSIQAKFISRSMWLPQMLFQLKKDFHTSSSINLSDNILHIIHSVIGFHHYRRFSFIHTTFQVQVIILKQKLLIVLTFGDGSAVGTSNHLVKIELLKYN